MDVVSAPRAHVLKPGMKRVMTLTESPQSGHRWIVTRAVSSGRSFAVDRRARWTGRGPHHRVDKPSRCTRGTGIGWRMRRSDGHRVSMKDNFGVPDSMFGPVPEDFYAVVGRIVLVTTMVEDRTLVLLWALDDATQDTHAGRSASHIRREVATRTTRHAAVLGGDDLVSHLSKVLADLNIASARRNALVHSLWPNPTEELAQGWRSVRQPRGVEPHSEVSWTLTSLGALKDDHAELVELQERLVMIANQVWAVRGIVPLEMTQP